MRMRTTTFASGWLLALAACVACASPQLSRAQQPVALATEVSGYVETRAGSDTIQVKTLSEFAFGARVRLKKDARLAVLFYASGDAWLATGPALVRVGDAAVEGLSGNGPQRIPGPASRNGDKIKLRPGGLTQAGVVARGVARPITLFAPAGAVSLQPRPAFQWQPPAPGLSYRYTLRDSDDRIVTEGTTSGTSFDLPASVLLTAGERYRLSLSAKGADGTEFAINQRFRIADDFLRAQVENFLPPQDASASQRVAFAVWLEQSGLLEEARTHWREVAAQGVSVPESRLATP